jgi:hypothetical protein
MDSYQSFICIVIVASSCVIHTDLFKNCRDFLSYKAPIISENILTVTLHTSPSSAIGRFLQCLPLMDACKNYS